MKTLAGVLLVAACFVACTHSFPGLRDDDSDENKNVDTVLVLGSDKQDSLLRPVIDFSDMSFDESAENPIWSWPGWFKTNPFDSLQSSVQAMMKRLREQMIGIVSGISEEGVVPWGKIPDGANTTSTTKIVDGHVVTINETTYTDGDDVFATQIRIRIIDVKPQNETILLTESEADAEVTTLPTRTATSSTATNTPTPRTGTDTATATATASSEDERSTPSRSVETVEDFDNEIPKNQVDTLTA